MPETIQALPLVPLFEHQPREYPVPCQACRHTTTSNDHAVCNRCLDTGHIEVRCSKFCRDLARALAAYTEPAR